MSSTDWECGACGAAPFDSAESVERHAAQWHPGRPANPRPMDDHSASRRVDVLAEEAPHLLAEQNNDELRAALADLETLAADPRRDVSTLGIDLLDLHRRISTAAGIGEGIGEEPRTILVHINVELPATAPATTDDIVAEITAALEVATDDEHAADHVPALVASTWSIPLAEEI